MSEELPTVPDEHERAVEEARAERSELWLFARQTAIILTLVALLVLHSLLR